MKLVVGNVSHLRHASEVSGNHHGVGTSQILGFRIGRQAVQLSLASLPQIEEGDEVAVAGDVENGVLIARAYQNFANRAFGQWTHSWVLAMAFTVLFVALPMLLFGLAMLKGQDVPYGVLCYVVPCVPVAWMALQGFFGSLKSNHAARLVRSAE